MDKLDPKRVRYLVVHTAAHPGDPSAKEIRRWHMEDRNWSDIGYHWVIRKSGALEVGRSLEYQGAHCRGINAVSIGVCCSGDGDSQPFTPEQVETLLGLAVAVHRTYGVEPENLIGHREINLLVAAGKVPTEYLTTKSCPGRLVHLPRLRRLFGYLVHPPEPRPPEMAVPDIRPPAPEPPDLSRAA